MSVIARPTPQGWQARYRHPDGHPAHQGQGAPRGRHRPFRRRRRSRTPLPHRRAPGRLAPPRRRLHQAGIAAGRPRPAGRLGRGRAAERCASPSDPASVRGGGRQPLERLEDPPARGCGDAGPASSTARTAMVPRRRLRPQTGVWSGVCLAALPSRLACTPWTRPCRPAPTRAGQRAGDVEDERLGRVGKGGQADGVTGERGGIDRLPDCEGRDRRGGGEGELLDQPVKPSGLRGRQLQQVLACGLAELLAALPRGERGRGDARQRQAQSCATMASIRMGESWPAARDVAWRVVTNAQGQRWSLPAPDHRGVGLGVCCRTGIVAGGRAMTANATCHPGMWPTTSRSRSAAPGWTSASFEPASPAITSRRHVRPAMGGGAAGAARPGSDRAARASQRGPRGGGAPQRPAWLAALAYAPGPCQPPTINHDGTGVWARVPLPFRCEVLLPWLGLHHHTLSGQPPP